MRLSNYHSHCLFCDGRSLPEDFVKFAISNNFESYGFSSHSPLPFETFWNMSKEDVKNYFNEIERLKNKYKKKIKIYAGMEIDYLNEWYNASIPFFKDMPLDYRIGSVHFLMLKYPMSEKNMMCIDGSARDFVANVNKYFDGDVERVVKYYFKCVGEMVDFGNIDIVGHVDKIYMNAQHCEGFSVLNDWYKSLFVELLEKIARKGLMLEVNTKNLLSKNQLYPHEKYLRMVSAIGIPVVVNSDCHEPDKVNDGRKEAFELMKWAGFESTRELRRGKWVDVPL